MLIGGLIYYIYITLGDLQYWASAPNNFAYFILWQYILLALMIRIPITRRLRLGLAHRIMVILGVLLFINTIVGTIQFIELTTIQVETIQTTEQS